MRVIAISTLRAFWMEHPDAELPLKERYLKVNRANWRNFADMRKDFKSADYVGNQHYVFNIIGGKYRLVAAVKYMPKLVFVRFVGTHAEYERKKVSNV